MRYICANCLANGRRVQFATLEEVSKHLFEAHLQNYDKGQEELYETSKNLFSFLTLAQSTKKAGESDPVTSS